MPVEDLVRGRRPLEPKDLEAVEEALIAADLGPAAAAGALEALKARSAEIKDGGAPAMRAILREELRRALDWPPLRAPFSAKPWVVFVVGVNGAGKTTTIGKLARSWTAEGRAVLLVAADTFRAAAGEQLDVWAQRAGATLHRGAEGADPSAVLTDGLRMARARGADVVLVDTAGRLHTKGNLMAELAKMARVAGREVEGAPHETLLVLDATFGSNAIAQGREFAKAAGVTGLVLTKLDGTAKGGVAVAVVRELGVPIRFVGVGESAEDLLPFDPEAFADGLVG
ncbi:MAG TPA: signal recognition particle-docking protein FtsY [Vicinamibacteria bacterium]|nr:signal recognition particle-docking protein FtsY [Vicinamibacteria bacterium]